MMQSIYLIVVALLGLVIGSFLNVVIIRIPEEKSIAFPASHCVKCKKPLKWWHNIPLISYIFLKGRCYYCKEKISWQYPLVEFSSMLIFIFSFLKVGDFTNSLIISLVFDLLLALSIIDFRYKAVPDSLNLLALTLAIFSRNILHSLNDALLFAGVFTLLRFYLSYFIKKEAMGEADIILAATIGAMLGIKLGFLAIFLSALIALPVFIIIGKRDIQLPYIPFLAIALYITFMFNGYFTRLLGWLYA